MEEVSPPSRNRVLTSGSAQKKITCQAKISFQTRVPMCESRTSLRKHIEKMVLRQAKKWQTRETV